jgi:hypothetical protein
MRIAKAPVCNSIPLLPLDFGNQRVASDNRCLGLYTDIQGILPASIGFLHPTSSHGVRFSTAVDFLHSLRLRSDPEAFTARQTKPHAGCIVPYKSSPFRALPECDPAWRGNRRQGSPPAGDFTNSYTRPSYEHWNTQQRPEDFRIVE